jgi:tellurite resistance protein TerC
MYTVGTWWMWIGFLVFIAIVLTIDIVLLDRKKSHSVTSRQALSWIAIWVTCALIFNGLLWYYLSYTQSVIIANQKALEFFTGYVIEQSLSVDNMFIFIMIFSYFKVPAEYQRRVLLYGVLSAVVLRLLMILGGTWLVTNFHWILYVFGAFLVITGIKMLFPEKAEKTLDQNLLLIFLRRYLRITEKFQDEKFFIKQNYFWYATPLFLVLIFVEISDLIFALDSVPAIFAITNDPFIVFTSNIFAILGLRAMYFLLANMAPKFHLLKYGIALVLTFVGTKMVLAHWITMSIVLALSVIAAILVTTIILSLLIRPRGKIA